MRNVFTFILVVFYFFISIKITANVHVCQGKFKSICIVGFTKAKKCCQSKSMSSGCCKDFKFSLKKSNSEENNSSTIIIPSPSIEALPFIQSEIIFPTKKISVVKQSKTFHDPPPPNVFQKIYIKNCTYLI